MKAAYFLGAAGLVTPDDSEAGAKLEKYIDSRAIRQDLAEHPEIADRLLKYLATAREDVPNWPLHPLPESQAQIK